MGDYSRKLIWYILGGLVVLGIIFLIFVSFQRTSTTKSEVKSQLESSQPTAIDIDTTVIKDTLLNKAQLKQAIVLTAKADSSKIDNQAEHIIAEQREHSTKLYLVTLGTALLIAFSSLCIGSFIGFLFGIPRVRPTNGDQDMEQKRSRIFHNDNLVEISDWLTKIIVGVGLTQITSIPEMLDKLGAYLGPCFTAHVDSAEVGDSTKAIAISTVLYFLIVGFIAFYLWTRFEYSKMLNKMLDEQTEGDTVDPNQAPEAPEPAA